MSGGNQPIQSVSGVPGQSPTSSAGIMALISDVERQLASLREADEQRRLAEEALATREAAANELEQRARATLKSNEELAAQLLAQRESIEAESARIETERQAIEAARHELDAQRADLERELDRISALEDAAKRAQAAAEAAEREAAEAAARAQSSAQDAEQRRAQMERALAEKAAAFRAAEERMEQRATDSSSMIAEAQTLAESYAAQIDALKRELQDARTDAGRLATDLETKGQVIAARNDELKSLRAQAAVLREKSGGDAALKSQLAELTAAQARSSTEIEALTAALAEAERKAEDYLRHIAEVEGQLAESTRLLDSATSAPASGADADPELLSQVEEIRSARDEAIAEAEKLREFARTLGQELSAARAQADAAPAHASDSGDLGPPIRSGDFIEARRERLRQQRKLLRSQAEKVKRAGDAVRDRFEQVEQILAQRAELIAAKKSVDDIRRKSRSRQARSGAIAALFYVTLAMLIYAGIGWVVAQKVAPAIYAVSARVEADASGRPPSAAELEEWRRYHEGLLVDPRFMETAAEKMKQRGIASLATAASLKSRLDADMTLLSDTPGTLTVELRGLGAAKTQRILDTLVTTFVRSANSARERRVDGTNTIIAVAATPDPTPLYDERIYYAAGIAGALTILSSIAAFILWRKLYEAKASIERVDEFDGLMDERRWRMPSRPA